LKIVQMFLKSLYVCLSGKNQPSPDTTRAREVNQPGNNYS
jgi:hypothetical protein